MPRQEILGYCIDNKIEYCKQLFVNRANLWQHANKNNSRNNVIEYTNRVIRSIISVGYRT